MRTFIFLFVVLVCVLSVLGATETTPGFENQQFYGVVSWDAGVSAPLQVIAKTSVKVYSSAIKEVQCGATACSGKYGYSKDTILRVQATSGETITFFIDLIEVKKESYSPGSSTKLDLSLVSGDVAAQGEEDTNQMNKTNQTGETSSSDTNNKYYPSTPSSSSPAVVAEKCMQNWDCSAWGDCVNGVEGRNCFRSDSCDLQLKQGKVKSVVPTTKPVESRSCVTPITGAEEVPSYIPAAEEDRYVAPIVQKPAVMKKEDVSFVQNIMQSKNFNYYLYGILGFLVLVGIGVGIFFFVRGRSGLDEGTRDELEGVYSTMERKGLTDEEITSKLVSKGWDESVLEKFLKKR